MYNYDDIQLPDEVEAERSIIGTLLLDSKYLPVAISKIKNNNFFYSPMNKKIFKTMVDMFANGENIDFVTVLAKIDVGQNEKHKYQEYMLDATNIVPHIGNFNDYVEIVNNSYRRRESISIGREILEKAHFGNNSEDVLEFAEKRILELKLSDSSKKPKHIVDICHEYCNWLEKANSMENAKILGIPSKFKKLDNCIGGLGRSNLILLAARPGMGKTSFALNIAKNVSGEFKILIFSLEMSRQQLASKLLSSETMIDSSVLARGIIKDENWTDISEASDRLSYHKLFIDDTAGITVNEIKTKTIMVGNVDLIIIDYLQLISKGKRIYSQARNEEITEITRNLKIMAKELDIPIICLSQLSRACEQRMNHRPMLSDLRDSGSIEQDADQVIMLYRPGYYDSSSDPKECECIVAKNRHGMVGTIMFKWEPKINLFSEQS